MKDKKGAKSTNAFQNILDKSNRKPNKIWVDTCSECYYRLIKPFLQNNDTEMYSTNHEGKSVVASLEPYKLKFKNTWLQFQDMFVLINRWYS